ncbi:F-box/kelch-repeat protein At1g57790-like [Andrographis paniculata]|uniref:F-box/kelch-repeat protein At1g57790-like n=1 Tax=Andrographis paniculata TaxID=175694 RepID=UPI0021E7D732|nr:F-box/kelch-repeat protein At1g57790-like [Andrographis paniculata]
MSGRTSNRSMQASSSEIVHKREKLELDLPPELLEKIMSSLCSGDRARASCVCRKWRDIAKSHKKTNRPPMNVRIRTNDDFFDICDLSRCLSNMIMSPNRLRGIVSYAKDGWMLFYDDDDAHVINFYNPQSNEHFELPKMLHFSIRMAAFSAPPTSPNCTVFLLPRTITAGSPPDVIIWRPGDTGWTNVEYDTKHPSITSNWMSIVAHNGNFYCMNIHGYIGEYDPGKCGWRALPYESLGCARYVPLCRWRKSMFLAMYDAKFFLVRTWGVAQPHVYKSDGISCTWKKVSHLDGMTFFASATTSLIRDDLPDVMKNCIYFPERVDNGRHCLVYSMKLKKFYRESQRLKQLNMEFLGDVWMDLGGEEVPEMKERDDIDRMNRDVAAAFERMHIKAFGSKLVA